MLLEEVNRVYFSPKDTLTKFIHFFIPCFYLFIICFSFLSGLAIFVLFVINMDTDSTRLTYGVVLYITWIVVSLVLYNKQGLEIEEIRVVDGDRGMKKKQNYIVILMKNQAFTSDQDDMKHLILIQQEILVK